MAAINRLVAEGIDGPALEAAIQSAFTEAAIQSINIDPFVEEMNGIKPHMQRLTNTTASAMQKRINETIGVKVNVDNVMDQATLWANSRSANLVREVTDETKAAIRHIVGTNIAARREPKTAAKRIKSIVGLTEKMADAVDRRYDSLAAEGLSEAEIDRKIAAYRKKLIDWRAMNIARTETMRSANAGMQQSWYHSQKVGAFAGYEPMKLWMIADGDADTICLGIADKFKIGVPIAATFDGLEHPPAHPQCRCQIVLRLIKPKENIADRDLSELKTASEIGDWLEARLGGPKISFDTGDPESTREIAETFDKLHNDPRLKKYVEMIPSIGIGQTANSQAFAETLMLGEQAGTIIFNVNFTNNRAKAKYNYDYGKMVKNLSTSGQYGHDSTAVHEFGHAFKTFLAWDGKPISSYMTNNRRNLNNVSRYGSTNEEEGFAEMLAEWFLEPKDNWSAASHQFNFWVQDHLK